MKNLKLSLYIDAAMSQQLDAYMDWLRQTSPMPDEVKRSRVARTLLKSALTTAIESHMRANT